MKDSLIFFAFGACAFCAAISGALHAAPVASLAPAGLSASSPTAAALAAPAPDEADPDAKPAACQPAPVRANADAID